MHVFWSFTRESMKPSPIEKVNCPLWTLDDICLKFSFRYCFNTCLSWWWIYVCIAKMRAFHFILLRNPIEIRQWSIVFPQYDGVETFYLFLQCFLCLVCTHFADFDSWLVVISMLFFTSHVWQCCLIYNSCIRL
jgi:hypothetical protein